MLKIKYSERVTYMFSFGCQREIISTLIMYKPYSGNLVGRAFAPSAESRGFELTPGWIKSKIEKFPPVAFQVNVHHLRPRAGLVCPVSV